MCGGNVSYIPRRKCLSEAVTLELINTIEKAVSGWEISGLVLKRIFSSLPSVLRGLGPAFSPIGIC